MRVVHEDGAVNRRRYGPVWIAKVTGWPVGKPPALEFGGNVGPDTAEILAEPGDLVKRGRKDYRGNNTVNEFAVVAADGSLQPLGDRAARALWLETHPEAGVGP